MMQQNPVLYVNMWHQHSSELGCAFERSKTYRDTKNWNRTNAFINITQGPNLTLAKVQMSVSF